MGYRQMRVLHILPQFQPGGGIDKVVINYFHYMDHQRFQFDILCHECTDSEYARQITASGGHVYIFPEVRPSNIFKLVSRYNKILDDRNYDVVHCHMANAAFIYLQCAKRKGVPLRIIHSHQDHYADKLSHSLRNIPLIKLGRVFANYNLACSQNAGDFLFKNKEYSVLYNAVDTRQFKYSELARFKFRSALGLTSDQILFGFVGRLAPQKNPLFMIEIFAALREKKKFAEARLIIAGDGELRDSMISMCEQLGLTDSVIWLGNVPDTSGLYSGLDGLLLPSLYEGLPMVLVEAQSSGLSCFVSDLVSKESQITDKVTFLSISAPAKRWSEVISEQFQSQGDELSRRLDYAEKVSKAGYGLQEQSVRLSTLYNKMVRLR